MRKPLTAQQAEQKYQINKAIKNGDLKAYQFSLWYKALELLSIILVAALVIFVISLLAV